MNNTVSSRIVIGWVLTAICIFLWGITFVCTKSLLNDFSALEILFFRFLAAYIGLWIIRPKPLKVHSMKDNLWFLLAGLTGITVYQFSENIAISYTTASNVSIIVAISPLFTALFSQWFLKEKAMNRWFLLGFVLAIFGVAFVSFNGHAELSLSPKGDLLALMSAISWGLYSVIVSKVNAMNYDKVLVTRRFFFFALIFMIPLMISGLSFGKEGTAIFVTFDKAVNLARFSKPMNWVNLLFLGWGASAFCFVAWNIACHAVGTVKATIAIYLIPVVTIVFAFIFLGETITLMGLLGTALVIVGLWISGKK